MSSRPDFENSFQASLWMLGPLAAVIVAALAAFPLSYEAPSTRRASSIQRRRMLVSCCWSRLAIEARLFRLRGMPHVKLVNPTKLLTNERARKTWTTLYVALVVITAGVMIWIERQILLTLARGDYARASARGVFEGLVFGLIVVAAAGLMLPTDSGAAG